MSSPINKSKDRPVRVLVCALDWGLGHATRSIPVIRELKSQGAEVMIASSGLPLELLRREFPELRSFELPGYSPRYHRSGSLAIRMLMQVPHFISVMGREHRMIEDLVEKHQIRLIVSDHRYGCYSREAASIFLAHQIKVLPLPGLRWMSKVLNSLLRRRINKFSEVWIPDQPGSGLGLAFKGPTKSPQYYVGWLSRFDAQVSGTRNYDILAIASGPEPQRTVFFDVLLESLKKHPGKSLLVAGEPGLSYHRTEGLVEIVSHLTADQLQEAMATSDVVIARSGYSTIMDLIAMQKKAVLVPTPQQTEQLSLAKILSDKGIAPMANQHQPNLQHWLDDLRRYRGFSAFKMNRQLLSENVSRILSSLR